MRILALDTSGPVASAAAWEDGALRAEMALDVGLTHSETILPAVDAVLRACGWTCEDADAFAAVAGPGSFTGVRIGVCAVKGMAHAAGKPCARVHALEALAMSAFGFDGTICPILDARRDQVYSAAFRFRHGELPERVLGDAAQSVQEYFSSLPGEGRLLFLGDGAGKYASAVRERFGERAILAKETTLLRASSACALAARRACEWMSAEQLTPIYFRAPQAEREKNERAKKEREARAD